jgi:hypothetical protein
MTPVKNDNFYKNFTSIILTLISIFGVFSVILLVNVNNKLNRVITENAVQDQKIQTLQAEVAELKLTHRF